MKALLQRLNLSPKVDFLHEPLALNVLTSQQNNRYQMTTENEENSIISVSMHGDTATPNMASG